MNKKNFFAVLDAGYEPGRVLFMEDNSTTVDVMVYKAPVKTVIKYGNGGWVSTDIKTCKGLKIENAPVLEKYQKWLEEYKQTQQSEKVIVEFSPVSERYWKPGDEATISKNQIRLGGCWFPYDERTKVSKINGSNE